MDLYHSWIYEYVLNSKWFLWTIVIIIFAVNIFGPVLFWLIINSKSKLNKDKKMSKSK